jgi:hypothetical protein
MSSLRELVPLALNSSAEFLRSVVVDIREPLSNGLMISLLSTALSDSEEVLIYHSSKDCKGTHARAWHLMFICLFDFSLKPARI